MQLKGVETPAARQKKPSTMLEIVSQQPKAIISPRHGGRKGAE